MGAGGRVSLLEDLGFFLRVPALEEQQQQVECLAGQMRRLAGLRDCARVRVDTGVVEESFKAWSPQTGAWSLEPGGWSVIWGE